MLMLLLLLRPFSALPSNIKSVDKLADEVVEKFINLKVGERPDDANSYSGVKPIPDDYLCL